MSKRILVVEDQEDNREYEAKIAALDRHSAWICDPWHYWV
jgi:hypothetical protein